MNEKKILIFEDEWSTIRGSFELANIYAFNGSLNFHQVDKSQSVTYDSWTDKYDAVFVDITLAKNTKWDGFNIVSEIKMRNLIDLKKVVVMTGNNRVKEKLEEMGIDTEVLQVLYKPIAFVELSDVLKKILSE